MDFFASQDRARKKTGQLVALFALGLAAVVLLVYLVVAAALMAVDAYGYHHSRDVSSYRYSGDYRSPFSPDDNAPATLSPAGGRRTLWDPRLFVLVTAGTLLIVGAASWYRVASLRGGGQIVALGLGGRLIVPGQATPEERRLLNVVEEMAIASGIPVPPVYVLDREPGINAFAAGYAPNNAVVTVTNGTLKLLSRDELQGVIGHEFSHVFNGDMRLNIKLMGWIYGLVALGLVGYGAMRVSGEMMRYAPSRGRGKDKGGAAGLLILILVVGMAVWAIGSIGVLFGRLIRAAVSRQREFLADASSVQFTRNPSGIVGALKKIGGYASHSTIQAHAAQEASHMFFGQCFEQTAVALFDTHPPLAERIHRLDPQFDGVFPEIAALPLEPSDAAPGEQWPGLAGLAASATRRMPAAGPWAAAAVPPALNVIGQPTQSHVDYAAQLIASIPASLRQAAAESSGARAVILGLLLDRQPDIRQNQLSFLAGQPDQLLADQVRRLIPALDALPPAARLPLIDLTLPALLQMSLRQYQEFMEQIAAFIAADQRLSLLEWTVQRTLRGHLESHFTGVRPPSAQYYSLRPLAEQCATLLAALANRGSPDAARAAQAYSYGWTQLGLDIPAPALPDPTAIPFARLDDALEHLQLVSPREKRTLLQACAACIAADRQITEAEAAIFRALSAALNCPVPPLLPGQPLA